MAGNPRGLCHLEIGHSGLVYGAQASVSSLKGSSAEVSLRKPPPTASQSHTSAYQVEQEAGVAGEMSLADKRAGNAEAGSPFPQLTCNYTRVRCKWGRVRPFPHAS